MALSCNIRRLKPTTLQAVYQQLGFSTFEQGEIKIDCLRIDSTVVHSIIAPPSDSKLLDDGIRVLSRLIANSGDCTGVKVRLTDYRKRSRSLAARIFYGKKAQKEALYPELLSLPRRVVSQSDKAIEQVQKKCDLLAFAQPWIDEVAHYRALLERVVEQTERRVLKVEKVQASQKLVSLFEPHTDIIIKGPREIEYGQKINLATDKKGLITALMIEEGNPTDVERFMPMIKLHQSLYGVVPRTTIAEDGYASLDNIDKGKAAGIKQVGFHKKKGISVSAMGLKEKTLKKLRDFRAGIEGNISELKRAFGASKALWKGEDGFVWASVISYNLTRLVRLNSG